MKAFVTFTTGHGLARWARGMLVLLEKGQGCHLISKLRLILLMEANFNCVNKIISQMLRNVRAFGFMPDEVFSEQNCTAEEGSLAKILFYNIV
jgi:hypothetical protein